MEKEISFNEGLRLTPYSDVSPDGELSVCHNVEVYGGGLRPTVIEGKEFTVRTGQESVMTGELMHIHATGEFQHLIFWDEQDYIWWCNEGENNDEVVPIKIWENAVQGITSISSVGNVLVVTTSDEVYYAIWKTASYVWLGATPELNVRWRLYGEYKALKPTDYESTINYPGGGQSSEVYYNYYAALQRQMEKYFAAQSRFVHPFLVRAAYRMMDGKTWTKATPPVLICPNVDMPLWGYTGQDIIGPTGDTCCVVLGDLYAWDIDMSNFPSEWRGLIQGVDIFMSEPLDEWVYQYQGNTMAKSLSDIFLATDAVVDLGTGYGLKKGLRGNREILGQLIGTDAQAISNVLTLDRKEDDMLKGMYETGLFYKVMSLSLNELSNIDGREFRITLGKNVYENIVQQERLKVAEDSHDTVGCGVSYAYNRRLTLADLKRNVHVGSPVEECSLDFDFGDEAHYDCYWRREENGVVSWRFAGYVSNDAYERINYLFTPDSFATHFYLIGDGEVVEYRLDEHPFLVGRYHLALPHHIRARIIQASWEVSDSGDAIRYERNTLRTSEVNNPFVFGAEGWNEAGNGRVLALASITKALSEGQFGQFPLMALCTDGNYALEVIKSGDMAGLYGGASAMPRDVCINRESVTQIDGAILFVSNRGVMMADGNDIRCISESLNGPMERSLLMAVTQEDVYDGQGEKLRDFFETCRIIWDYTSQRAIFFQDDNNFALQYRDGAWSSIELPRKFKGVQNIYPYSYIHRDDGTVLVLDDDYNFGDTMHYGVVETRPLKMDTLQMKKLCEFALQGRFEGERAVTLFGSNDMTNWDDLGTTTRRRVPHVVGRWYKYWRFLIQANLKESEHISGLRIRYDVRGETRVR